MTMQAQVLNAVENMINELGQLRAAGVPADAWHSHIHELRAAAWKAYHAQKAIVDKQEAQA